VFAWKVHKYRKAYRELQEETIGCLASLRAYLEDSLFIPEHKRKSSIKMQAVAAVYGIGGGTATKKLARKSAMMTADALQQQEAREWLEFEEQKKATEGGGSGVVSVKKKKKSLSSPGRKTPVAKSKKKKQASKIYIPKTPISQTKPSRLLAGRKSGSGANKGGIRKSALKNSTSSMQTPMSSSGPTSPAARGGT
jgi:hypothetical protein